MNNVFMDCYIYCTLTLFVDFVDRHFVLNLHLKTLCTPSLSFSSAVRFAHCLS